MPEDTKPENYEPKGTNISRLTEINGYTDDERFNSVKFNHWEDIGFQRPLGNFLYGYMIVVVTAIIGIVLVSFVYQYLWPYPQIQGYNGIAGGVFAIVYQLFDVGTAFGIVRFIAEWRVKNPRKMLEYVRFYIWYQMFTGIVQIGIISVVILNVFRFNQFAYLSWIFLIILQKQWPAMLGMFKSVLEGLQLYNKTQVLGLVSGQVFQNLTNIIFIIIGRYLGSMNPAVGELMGMVFGAAIGSYVDDFFAMWLSVHFFNKAMKPFGVTARDCMRADFSRDVVKECLWFGLQVSIVPLINTATSTTMLLMYLERMPQYSTWIVLAGLASGVSGIVDAGSFNLTAAIAESFMNGKKELAKFYVETTFKWNGFLMCFLTLTLISVMPMLMTEVIKLPGLENYLLAVPFLVPSLVHKLFMPWIGIPDTVLIGTMHISFYTINRVIEEVNQVFFVWLYLYVFNLNLTFGIGGIVYILAFEHFWPRIIKMIACFLFIQKRVMKLKINWMQTFVVPLVSSIPVLAAGFLYYAFAFQPLKGLFGFLDEYALLGPAAIFVLIGLLIFPLFVFLPLTGYLGGWDDFGLLTFRKAVDLSGPTKPVAMLMFKSIMFGARRSKYHNRFKSDWSGAAKEIEELMIMKETQTAVKYEKPVSPTAPWLNRLLRRKKQEDKPSE